MGMPSLANNGDERKIKYWREFKVSFTHFFTLAKSTF